ncbi:MAG: type II toxin-antitoxin system Phd/YefM family antitoxin [Acidobacteriota bacterium]
MTELHPQIIEKDGKKEFVVLPFEEFLRIEEELASYRDLQELREAKEQEKDAPDLSLAQVKAELDLD